VRNRAALLATPVLTGLLAQAVTTYLVLVIAGRYLGASGFGSLSALYLLVTSIATGLFLPLEQEVARRRGDEAWAANLGRHPPGPSSETGAGGWSRRHHGDLGCAAGCASPAGRRSAAGGGPLHCTCRLRMLFRLPW